MGVLCKKPMDFLKLEYNWLVFLMYKRRYKQMQIYSTNTMETHKLFEYFE